MSVHSFSFYDDVYDHGLVPYDGACGDGYDSWNASVFAVVSVVGISHIYLLETTASVFAPHPCCGVSSVLISYILSDFLLTEPLWFLQFGTSVFLNFPLNLL